MPNEDLIYRITRAVYGRLGAGADERVVENLVTDIYRAIEPVVEEHGGAGDDADLLGRGSWHSLSPRKRGKGREGSEERIVVSVFGVDHPGIVAGVTNILADSQCSIADINQTVVQGKFAMVIIADTMRSNESVAALKDRFRQEGERLGVNIYAQREDLFHAMHRI
ncbi:MAG: ACT domain-containing protein [Pyrinomonadaceae bacterium]|nr:ACT domain-containing protein [Pyrinomonadaceae bacterium]